RAGAARAAAPHRVRFREERIIECAFLTAEPNAVPVNLGLAFELIDGEVNPGLLQSRQSLLDAVVLDPFPDVGETDSPGLQQSAVRTALVTVNALLDEAEKIFFARDDALAKLFARLLERFSRIELLAQVSVKTGNEAQVLSHGTQTAPRAPIRFPRLLIA